MKNMFYKYAPLLSHPVLLLGSLAAGVQVIHVPFPAGKILERPYGGGTGLLPNI